MPGTPYITAAMLLSRPMGISWTAIPALTASGPDQTAQLAQECWTATARVDTYCRQPLRATINTETGAGPGRPHVNVNRDTQIGGLITRQWPVTSVAAVQVSQSKRLFPPEWTLVPAGQYSVRHPVMMYAAPGPVTGPSGGNAIDVAPRWINWDWGRGGWNVMVSYGAGWPHTSLTAAAVREEPGPQTVTVDDVTGWAGVTGWVYDGQGTETVTVTAVTAASPVQLPGAAGTVQAGPGTLTLAAPLAFYHGEGTVISALPASGIRGAALYATSQALEGIDAIATQSMSGQPAGSTGALATAAEMELDDFRRVA